MCAVEIPGSLDTASDPFKSILCIVHELSLTSKGKPVKTLHHATAAHICQLLSVTLSA